MPPTDQTGAPDLRSVERSVRRQEQRLVHAWRTAIALNGILVVAVPGLLVWLWPYADSPLVTLVMGVVAWVVVLASAIVQLLPGPRPAERSGLVLRGRGDAEARAWLESVTEGWHPRRVVLAAPPDVKVTLEGDIRIGAALVACLREEELALLVREAYRTRRPFLGRRSALTSRLLAGRVGRALEPEHQHHRRPWNPLGRWVWRRARAHRDALEVWDKERPAARDDATRRALAAKDVVQQGLDLVVESYLSPALGVGAWHDAPFTGVRHVLSAWEEVGADVWGGSRADDVVSTGPAHLVLSSVMAQERELAAVMVGDHPHDDEPTPWDAHTERVCLPVWRQRSAAVLEATRVATGRPQPASLAALVELIESGWAESIVAHLIGPVEVADPPGVVHAVMAGALEDLLALTLVEAGTFALAWSWLDGGELVDPHGHVVDVSAIVSRALPDDAPHRLEDLLAEAQGCGADPWAPVWLEGGSEREPEDALLSVVAGQRLGIRSVVLSDRAVRVFPYARREYLRDLSSGDFSRLDRVLDAVRTGDLTEQCEVVRLSDVVRATVSPAPTGGQWVLRMSTTGSSCTLHMTADPDGVVPVLQDLLGDRLARVGWMLPRPVRWLRTAWVWTSLSVATLGIITVTAFFGPSDMPGRVAGWGGLAALLGILAVFLPDALVRTWWRWRTPRSAVPLG